MMSFRNLLTAVRYWRFDPAAGSFIGWLRGINVIAITWGIRHLTHAGSHWRRFIDAGRMKTTANAERIA
jgi:hypothetical protein